MPYSEDCTGRSRHKFRTFEQQSTLSDRVGQAGNVFRISIGRGADTCICSKPRAATTCLATINLAVSNREYVIEAFRTAIADLPKGCAIFTVSDSERDMQLIPAEAQAAPIYVHFEGDTIYIEFAKSLHAEVVPQEGLDSKDHEILALIIRSSVRGSITEDIWEKGGKLL